MRLKQSLTIWLKVFVEKANARHNKSNEDMDMDAVMEDGSNDSNSNNSNNSNSNSNNSNSNSNNSNEDGDNDNESFSKIIETAVRSTLVCNVHEITITNQIMHLKPSIEVARMTIFQQLQAWINIICGLPKLKSSRYSAAVDSMGGSAAGDASNSNNNGSNNSNNSNSKNYGYLFLQLCQSNAILIQVYQNIENSIQEVEAYIQTWSS